MIGLAFLHVAGDSVSGLRHLKRIGFSQLWKMIPAVMQWHCLKRRRSVWRGFARCMVAAQMTVYGIFMIYAQFIVCYSRMVDMPICSRIDLVHENSML